MCPSHYARVGGIIFTLAGLLGFSFILGPTSTQSILGGLWWIDWFEGAFYLLLGPLLVIASFFPAQNERPVVLFSGWLLLMLSVYGIFSESLFMHFENPVQGLLYLLMAAWALSAGFCKEKNETRAGNLT